MRNVLDKSCRENENTHFIFNNFFRKSHRLWDMSKNIAETEGPQMTLQYGAYALPAWVARLYAHTRMRIPTHPATHMHGQARIHRPICNACCFYTATMVTWTRFNITLHVPCLSCSYYIYLESRVSDVLYHGYLPHRHDIAQSETYYKYGLLGCDAVCSGKYRCFCGSWYLHLVTSILRANAASTSEMLACTMASSCKTVIYYRGTWLHHKTRGTKDKRKSVLADALFSITISKHTGKLYIYIYIYIYVSTCRCSRSSVYNAILSAVVFFIGFVVVFCFMFLFDYYHLDMRPCCLVEIYRWFGHYASIFKTNL
jgi:hypothetical protein